MPSIDSSNNQNHLQLQFNDSEVIKISNVEKNVKDGLATLTGQLEISGKSLPVKMKTSSEVMTRLIEKSDGSPEKALQDFFQKIGGENVKKLVGKEVKMRLGGTGVFVREIGEDHKFKPISEEDPLMPVSKRIRSTVNELFSKSLPDQPSSAQRLPHSLSDNPRENDPLRSTQDPDNVQVNKPKLDKRELDKKISKLEGELNGLPEEHENYQEVLSRLVCLKLQHPDARIKDAKKGGGGHPKDNKIAEIDINIKGQKKTYYLFLKEMKAEDAGEARHYKAQNFWKDFNHVAAKCYDTVEFRGGKYLVLEDLTKDGQGRPAKIINDAKIAGQYFESSGGEDFNPIYHPEAAKISKGKSKSHTGETASQKGVDNSPEGFQIQAGKSSWSNPTLARIDLARKRYNNFPKSSENLQKSFKGYPAGEIAKLMKSLEGLKRVVENSSHAQLGLSLLFREVDGKLEFRLIDPAYIVADPALRENTGQKFGSMDIWYDSNRLIQQRKSNADGIDGVLDSLRETMMDRLEEEIALLNDNLKRTKSEDQKQALMEKIEELQRMMFNIVTETTKVADKKQQILGALTPKDGQGGKRSLGLKPSPSKQQRQAQVRHDKAKKRLEKAQAQLSRAQKQQSRIGDDLHTGLFEEGTLEVSAGQSNNMRRDPLETIVEEEPEDLQEYSSNATPENVRPPQPPSRKPPPPPLTRELPPLPQGVEEGQADTTAESSQPPRAQARRGGLRPQNHPPQPTVPPPPPPTDPRRESLTTENVDPGLQKLMNERDALEEELAVLKQTNASNRQIKDKKQQIKDLDKKIQEKAAQIDAANARQNSQPQSQVPPAAPPPGAKAEAAQAKAPPPIKGAQPEAAQTQAPGLDRNALLAQRKNLRPVGERKANNKNKDQSLFEVLERRRQDIQPEDSDDEDGDDDGWKD